MTMPLLLVALCAVSPLRAQERVLTHSAIIDCSADELWSAFTTEAGVVKAWSVAKAKVDFRVGGTIKTLYDPKKEIGDPATITNTILAYEPRRMVAIQATPPAGAPAWLELICKTGWSVIRFEPLAADKTRLTITGLGYGEGKDFDTAFAHFDAGNKWTLDEMQKKFGAEAAKRRAAATWLKLEALTKGEWICDRARQRFRSEHSGAFVVANGWLGDEHGMKPYADAYYSRDAERGVRFVKFAEGGVVQEGSVRLVGDTLVHEGTAHEGDKPARPFRIEIAIEDADHYRLKSGGVDLAFRRVE